MRILEIWKNNNGNMKNAHEFQNTNFKWINSNSNLQNSHNFHGSYKLTKFAPFFFWPLQFLQDCNLDWIFSSYFGNSLPAKNDWKRINALLGWNNGTSWPAPLIVANVSPSYTSVHPPTYNTMSYSSLVFFALIRDKFKMQSLFRIWRKSYS